MKTLISILMLCLSFISCNVEDKEVDLTGQWGGTIFIDNTCEDCIKSLDLSLYFDQNESTGLGHYNDDIYTMEVLSYIKEDSVKLVYHDIIGGMNVLKGKVINNTIKGSQRLRLLSGKYYFNFAGVIHTGHFELNYRE
jgi:hypothetical protein